MVFESKFHIPFTKFCLPLICPNWQYMLLTIALSNSSARGDITHPGSEPAIMKVMVEHGFIILFLIAVSSSTLTSLAPLSEGNRGDTYLGTFKPGYFLKNIL